MKMIDGDGMKKIKLILCDMDGTLLNSKKEEPAKFRYYVDKLTKQGIMMGIASGRQYVTLKEQFADISDKLLFISDNGTIVFQAGKCIYNNPMQKEDLLEIKRRLDNSSTAYMICCGLKGAYAFSENPEFIKQATVYCKNLSYVPSVAAIDDVICKVAIYDFYDAKNNILPLLSNLHSGLTAVHSSYNWVDVSNSGISKGSALKMLQEQLGISQNETMVFGDYLNDAEMLQEAHYSYAMENAVAEVKAIANFIAPSNDDLGVIKILEQYFGE